MSGVGCQVSVVGCQLSKCEKVKSLWVIGY